MTSSSPPSQSVEVSRRASNAGHVSTPDSNRDQASAPASAVSQRSPTVFSEIRRRLLNFTPSWFSVTMGTGISSILLKNLPYQFPHLDVIANTIFVLNVVLFCLFFLASAVRYTIWPTVWTVMLLHPVQSLYVGTFPMGLCTIVNMIVYTCVPAYGEKFVTLAWALWWVTAAVSVAIGIGMPFVIHTRHSTSFDQISGVWFLPIVTNVVCAASGGVVAEVLPPEHARLTLTVSYILWGLGVPVSFFLMPLYYARLAIHKLPPTAMIVSVFLPVGPCGQGAFGLLQLAKVLRKLSQTPGGLPSGGIYSESEVHMMVNAVYAISIIVALVLWGVGLFWLTNAVLTIGDLVLQKKIPFNMGFWGFTFPIGVFATATNSLASDLDSRAFRVLGMIISVSEVLLWLFVASKTAWLAWEGSLFFAPCLGPTGGEPPKRSNSPDLAANEETRV